jgi:membrane protein DedA with SNARE-associated domain
VYAALTIFGVVLSTLVLPLPEELALMGAGFWAHQGALPLWAAWVAATAGNVVGDTASYLVGRYFLDRLLRTRFGKRIVSPEMRKWGADFVKRHGFWAIVLGRFLVALRGPVYFAIGASKYPLGRFELVNSIVALVESAALVWLGYVFGRSTRVSHEVKWAEIAIGVVLVAILAVPPLVRWRLARSRRAAG